jgi:uncharacterized membrane protein
MISRMNRYGLFVVLLTIVVASAVIPAYAEVTSLKTNTSFYKGGSKINFTGSTLDTDPPNVTILLFDPANKFILLSSGVTNSNHQFQVVIDTSTSDNQQKFLLKGVYNATAFIATKENGKTVNFIYSPDGSPVVSSPPTSLTSSSMSSTEIDLSWTAPVNTGGASLFGYKIERDNGTGFVQIQNVQSTTYHDTGLTPSKLYSYRVSAVNQAGTSSPSNVATSVTLSPPVTTTTPPPTTTTPDQSTGLSLEEQIKQRLAVAQKIQQLLHGQNPTPSDTTGVKQTVTLSESLVLDDMAVNLGSQKSGGSFVSLPSGITNFDASALLYPAIILAGVVIVVAILYMRKKQRLSDNLVETRKETFVPVEITPEPQEDDHAMMILKNRLAKGEITIDEFKALKDELLEP